MTQKALHLGFFLNKSSFFVYIFKQNLDCMEKNRINTLLLSFFYQKESIFFKKTPFWHQKRSFFFKKTCSGVSGYLFS
jgi:hypothetical protein